MNSIVIKRKVLLKFLFFFLVFTSCVSKKEIVYFQNDKIDQTKVSNKYITTFKPDDLLQITISAQDLEAVKPFVLSTGSYNSGNNSTSVSASQQIYLVDTNGEVDFPLLGKIKLGGLTREKAIGLLKSKLDPQYIKNPNINIRISNFKITVLGDVANPGNYTIPNERITILEAIGLAGDLNISGQRNNVLVIREYKKQKIKYNVDLLSNNIITSPVYYLQQNDLVYVEHNKATIQSASYNQNTGLFISMGSILIALMSLLIR